MNYLKSDLELEKKLHILKRRFKLIGLKAEFEAEGSTVSDIHFLRRLTKNCNTKLFVKIGGVEAINDIYNCIEIGVDGIIAPMVETKFALYKFKESIMKLDIKNKPHLSINIETINGYKNIAEILKLSKNFIDNITVGRSDFSKSFFNKKIKQDSHQVLEKIIIIAKKAKKYNISTTVGGGINSNTIRLYRKEKDIKKLISRLETRKVILPTNIFLNKNLALNSALDFEKSYIVSKKKRYEMRTSSEINRLSILSTRN